MNKAALIISTIAGGLLVATTGSAQVGIRASTSVARQSPPAQEQEIVVQGQRRAVMRQLHAMIARDTGDQLARFEDRLCPIVIGMPRDLTAAMTRMIRANIESFGAKLEPVGCRPNGLVIFIDQPRELVEAIRKEQPDLLGMEPREASNFVADVGAISSWHITETRGVEGETLGNYDAGAMGSSKAKVTRSVTTSRLYSPARQEMMLGFVVIDRGRTVGHNLRQLSDLATMHLLLEIRASAATKDPNSILSLFEPRGEGDAVPQSLSRIDRGAMAGFYAQRQNNLTAAQQRSNIVRAIEAGAGEKKK